MKDNQDLIKRYKLAEREVWATLDKATQEVILKAKRMGDVDNHELSRFSEKVIALAEDPSHKFSARHPATPKLGVDDEQEPIRINCWQIIKGW